MANLVTTEANAILNASSGQASYTNPTPPIKVALVITTGSASAPGQEVSGGSYARQNIIFSAAAAGQIVNSAPVNFTGMPTCVVTGVDEWDSAGVRRWFGALQVQKNVNAGDTFTIAAGSYTKTLS